MLLHDVETGDVVATNLTLGNCVALRHGRIECRQTEVLEAITNKLRTGNHVEDFVGRTEVFHNLLTSGN